MKKVDREEAMTLLREHNRQIGHIRHALAVEAAMRFFARANGEDEEEWGLAGLVHDIDWETTIDDPSRHTHLGASWLRDAGYPDNIVRAVLAHGWGICSDVEPLSLMEKHLLVRPGKSLQDLTVKSVRKKWKDKAFARGVNREVIEKGTAMLEKPLEELVEGVIEALRPIEKDIGLGEED